MKCTYSLDINAPADRVFEYLRDPELMKQWLQGLEETRYLGDYDPARPLGARFRQKIREGGRVKEYDGEVTAFAPPKHLGVRLFSPQFSVQVDYHLTPVGDGTRLDYSADVTCNHWFIRLVARLFSFFMKGMLRKQLAKLKELAEGGT